MQVGENKQDTHILRVEIFRCDVKVKWLCASLAIVATNMSMIV